MPDMPRPTATSNSRTEVRNALAFVREQGVVLVSAKGPVPSLVDVIAGETIRGSWWAHPQSHRIFAILEQLSDSPEILICRLVEGRITFVHRRLWPALVRLSRHLNKQRLRRVRQEHTPSGKHVNRVLAYPNWVPLEVQDEASSMTEEDAKRMLGPTLLAACGEHAAVRR